MPRDSTSSRNTVHNQFKGDHHNRDHVPRWKDSRQNRSPHRQKDYKEPNRYSRSDNSPPKHRRDRSSHQYGSREQDESPQRQQSRDQDGKSRERDRNSRGRDRNRDRFPQKRAQKSSFLSDVQVKRENEYEWGKKEVKTEKDGKTAVEKEKPNFGLSGKLVEETNMVNGVVIKYSEPDDARKPNRRWRLYPFKGEKALPLLHIHRCSAFLMGRDRKVADIPLDHPSCSKQHAALQYRLVPFKRDNGTQGKRVRPYLIDLDSANGTFINGERLEPRKYYELFERDVIKFGLSTRDYVLLHEQSKDDNLDDDVNLSNE